MFYNNFLVLCEEYGVSPSSLLDEIGVGKGSLKRWREGGSPTNPTAKKIADYFGISVRELKEGKKITPTVNDDERVREAVRGLSREQIDSVMEYIEFLRSKRK
jgi:transcriptional regulator with XRE-family HTH domain